MKREFKGDFNDRSVLTRQQGNGENKRSNNSSSNNKSRSISNNNSRSISNNNIDSSSNNNNNSSNNNITNIKNNMDRRSAVANTNTNDSNIMSNKKTVRIQIPDATHSESDLDKKRQLPVNVTAHSILKGKQEQAATSERESSIRQERGGARDDVAAGKRLSPATPARPSAAQLPKLPKPEKYRARNVFGGRGWSGQGLGGLKVKLWGC